MPETTTVTATFDEARVNEILSHLPREVHTEARLRLAALASAASEEERKRIQGDVTEELLRAAENGGWCDSAEAALTVAFGEPEAGRWLRRDGFDRYGYDAEGYDRDGFDRYGYDREGFGRNGYDRDGLNRERRNRDGYDSDGYNVEGFNAQGVNRDGLDRFGLSPYRFDVTGFDQDGFNREGRDRNGFDRDGYGSDGYNVDGINRDGESMFRFDGWGWDRDGYNRSGTDYNGYTREMNAQEHRPARPGRTNHPRYAEYTRWENNPGEWRAANPRSTE